MAEAVQMDPTDLPSYAGRVHDHATDHPERHRLMMWGQLEVPAGQTPADDPLQQSLRHKFEQLRKAQHAGHLDPAWEPEDILVFVSQLATSWASQTTSSHRRRTRHLPGGPPGGHCRRRPAPVPRSQRYSPHSR